MTFGKVIQSIHFCRILNSWLIIGVAGCMVIAWFLSKKGSKQLPVKCFLFGIAFGMTVKGVWNISFGIAVGILGIEIALLASSLLLHFLL